MAYLDIYMYWNKKLSKRVLRNHVIKIRREIIIFRVFTAKIAFWQNLIYVSEKCNFHRTHPRYDNFIIITIFPTKHCIDFI